MKIIEITLQLIDDKHNAIIYFPSLTDDTFTQKERKLTSQTYIFRTYLYFEFRP